MIALGYLAQGVLGTNTVVDGLGCTPSVPASLAVLILPGSIYQQEPVDSVAYNSLGIDAVDQVVKQGIILPVTSLTLTPPGTAGQAINYLIQASVLELDTGSTVLSYFNSANPAVPFTGPAGSGTAQPTIRQCTISLVPKSGVAATAGTQVTPAPDAGFVPLWVVTVANGTTALTSSQISQHPNAPFISVKLPQVPAWVQGGTWDWAVDTGTANQIIVNLIPTPGNIQAGFDIKIKKMASPSTGAMTIIINGAPPIAVVNADGSALTASTPMGGGYLARIVFDGTSHRWTNPPISTAVGSLGASSGEGINVSGIGAVSLSYPSLSVQPVIANSDLWSFYSQGDTHHRVIPWAQLQGLFTPTGRILNIQILSFTSTYTKTPGATRGIVLGTGAGGAGSGGAFDISWSGLGGGAGATGLAYIDLTSVSTVPCTVGVGGAPIDPSNGADGTDTVFGLYFTAKGGAGAHTRGTRSLVSQGGICVVGSAQMLAFLAMGGGAGGTPAFGNSLADWTVAGPGGNSFWGGGGAPWGGTIGLNTNANSTPTPFGFIDGFVQLLGVVASGQAGQAPGSGGGGVTNSPGTPVGGAGAAGTIFIIELS